MPELPNKRYVRRGHIRKWLGIDDRDMTKLVEAGVFEPRYLQGKGRAYFERDAVVKAEREGKVMKAAKA